MKRTYPLRPISWALVVVALVVLAGCVAAAVTELGRHRGLVINGILHFNADEARVVWVVVTAASAVMTAYLVQGAWRLRGGRVQVVVDDDQIEIPQILGRRRIHVVRYDAITNVYLGTVKEHVFLYVEWRDHKRTVGQRQIGEEAFAELVAWLARKVPPPRSQLGTPEAPRPERPLASAPLEPPPRLGADPFRDPPAPRPVQVQRPELAATVEVVHDPSAPQPKLLK